MLLDRGRVDVEAAAESGCMPGPGSSRAPLASLKVAVPYVVNPMCETLKQHPRVGSARSCIGAGAAPTAEGRRVGRSICASAGAASPASAMAVAVESRIGGGWSSDFRFPFNVAVKFGGKLRGCSSPSLFAISVRYRAVSRDAAASRSARTGKRLQAAEPGLLAGGPGARVIAMVQAAR